MYAFIQLNFVYLKNRSMEINNKLSDGKMMETFQIRGGNNAS